jgi:LPS export ABC transporter permease LptG/LPS export ABC transporter permease LptF
LPTTRRPGWGLYRYIAGEAMRPFLFALIGLTFVALTTDLIGFSELVINRGLSARQVGLLAFYESVPVAALIFPFSILIGVLVALGRLGADRELLAWEACGLSTARLMGPVVAFAGGLGLLAGFLSLYGAPASSRALDRSLEAIAKHHPWAQLRAGTVQRFGGWQLEAREATPKGDVLRGVLVWMPDVGETLFARSGQVEMAPDGAAELTLRDASLLLTSSEGPQQLRFDAIKARLPDNDTPLRREAEERIRGMSLGELRAEATTQAEAGKRVPSALVEWHRRFATPVSAWIFGALAVPLFFTRRVFSRAGGSVLGVAATIAYFALAQLGEGLAHGGTLSVAGGVWLPNAALALLGALLFARMRRSSVLGTTFERRSRMPHRVLSRMRGGRPRRHALGRYVAGRFCALTLLAFAVLVTAYLLIDVMERLDWFARYQAGGDEILRFYAARIPLLASRVVPMALLVGTALVVSLLAVEGELTGMRACGIATPRALLPVLWISVLVAPAYFALRDVVVPRTNALADNLKETEIKEEFYRQLAESSKTAVWRRSGSRVLAAARFDTDQGEARELTIYELGEDGVPTSRTDAIAARHIGRGVWRLQHPRRIEMHAGHLISAPAHAYANLGEELEARVDTMHLSTRELAREIAAVEADGYDATQLRVDFHLKLADALACIVLPACVLFFALGGPPYPGPAQTLLVSGMLAVAYILLTGVGASLGYRGTLPPVLGGWGPTLALGALAGGLAARLTRHM